LADVDREGFDPGIVRYLIEAPACVLTSNAARLNVISIS